MSSSPLVIGIGNEYRSDDGVGLAVVRVLKGRKIKHIRFMESDGDCTILLEAWKGTEKVILIDAVSSGSQPGRIYRVDFRAQDIPTACTLSSSHAFGIAETIALARLLDQLPPSLILYGIEGAHFMAGNHLSPAVMDAVQNTAEQVMLDLQTP